MKNRNELILEALRYYQNRRWAFAGDITQKMYRKKDGSHPTSKDIKLAIATARAYDKIVGELDQASANN